MTKAPTINPSRPSRTLKPTTSDTPISPGARRRPRPVASPNDTERSVNSCDTSQATMPAATGAAIRSPFLT